MTIRSPGMIGRIAIVLVFALGLELLGNLALNRWQERELMSAGDSQRLAARLIEAERVALAAHPRDRGARMNDFTRAGVTINWVPRTVIADVSAAVPGLSPLRAELAKTLPRTPERDLRLTVIPSKSGQRDLLGAWQMSDATYITFHVSPFMAAPPHPTTVILLHLLLIASVLGVALLSVRALVQPLRNLASAADATGHGQSQPIPIEGPPEVRSVATAFSAMRERLLKAVDDQTKALIAVSHDLRTPIQRLRLRASLIDDAEEREAMSADLTEMETFIESTLAYVRTGEDEIPRLVDVAALIATVVDGAEDLGHDVRYIGPDQLLATVRPLSLKRSIANLVSNATRHADRVELTLQSLGLDRLSIDVDDNGPGIPADQRAQALLPFRRLNTARSGNSGGAGLGLPIALKSCEVAGGTLTLNDSHLGGLNAHIELPIG